MPAKRECAKCGKAYPETDEFFPRTGAGEYLAWTCKPCLHARGAERNRESGWDRVPREMRHRKPIALTLSEPALEKLERMAEARGESRSQVVDGLIMDAGKKGI